MRAPRRSKSFLVWPLAWTIIASGNPLSDQCLQLYNDRKHLWFSLSGTPATFWPGSTDAKSTAQTLWKELVKAGAYSADERPESIESMHTTLASISYIQLTHCRSHGGRYWEVRVPMRRWILHLIWNVSSNLGTLLRKRLEDGGSIPESIFGTFCAPAICEENDILSTIWPITVMRRLNFPFIVDASPAGVPWIQCEVAELDLWSSFSIDFALVGVDRCGTSSLRVGLDKHPEVGFSLYEKGIPTEDYYLGYHQAHRLVPTKKQVNDFNRRFEAHRPKLVGYSLPSLYYVSIAKVAIRFMEIPVVAIVCNPINRVERRFFAERWCHANLSEAIRTTDALDLKSLRAGDCSPTIAELLTPRGAALLEQWEVVPHVRSLLQMFGSRVFLAHQDELKYDTEHFWQRLAKHVGTVDAFPAEHLHRERTNARPGHRTDLCRNASLLKKIQSKLEPEYRGLESLLANAGSAVPESLLQRRSRCEALLQADNA